MYVWCYTLIERNVRLVCSPPLFTLVFAKTCRRRGRKTEVTYMAGHISVGGSAHRHVFSLKSGPSLAPLPQIARGFRWRKCQVAGSRLLSRVLAANAEMKVACPSSAVPNIFVPIIIHLLFSMYFFSGSVFLNATHCSFEKEKDVTSWNLATSKTGKFRGRKLNNGIEY